MIKIILPTDFSDSAQNAIDYALFLLEKETCTFFLLYAYHDAPSMPVTKLTRKNDLDQLLKRTEAKNDNPKHRFEMVIETDSVVNLVSRTAIDNAADYIFMGAKGYSTLHEVFLGSTTVDVIKYLECPCPIVAVPEIYQYDSPKEIMFASDFKHAFSTPELAPLIAISKLLACTVSVVHINTGKELSKGQYENKALLKDSLKEINTEFKEVTIQNSIASTLWRLEKENPQVGMIALLNTKHGFFKNLLHEPILKNVSFQTEVPLLVLSQLTE